MKNKLVVIGIDGGTFDIINPLIEKGELKTLKNLIDTGSKGYLRSTIPSYTPIAISSFLTGMNPGKHGIFDFFISNHDNYETIKNLSNSSTIGAPTLWEILNKADKKVISFLFPLSYPPQQVNGVMVSKVKPEIMKSKSFTYPESVKGELMAHLGNIDYSRIPFNADLKKKFKKTKLKNFFSRSLENLKYKSEVEEEATRYLIGKYNWDILTLYFNNTDLIQHWFWKFMDKNHPLHNPLRKEYSEEIFNIYKTIDSFIGDLLDRLGGNLNLFIFSDHGFGPLYYKFYLNKWLMDKGLLFLKEKNTRKLKFARRNLKKILRKVKLGWLSRALPDIINSFTFPVPVMRNKPLRDIIDWDKTKAYGTLFGVNINLKGREPMGKVERHEYDNLVGLIKKELVELNYRDKVPVIDDIFQKEELYSGEYLDYATDILFTFKKEFPCQVTKDLSDGEVLRETDGEELLSGTHFSSINGILIANGPDISIKRSVNGASIVDLLPTILYLMGTPIPSNIDGKVLTDLVEKDYLRQNLIKFSDDIGGIEREEFIYTEEERKALQKELKSLGYIE